MGGDHAKKHGVHFSEREMELHREYMKKYQKASSDLAKTKCTYKDHYEMLGISRDATHTEIRKAYRKLALQFHPDRNSSPEAEKRWDGVPAAYAVLSDPNTRAEYDDTLPTRDALVEFYRQYNPAKLDNATIQTIVEGWTGREAELFRMLNIKYEIAPHQGVNRRLSGQRLPADKQREILRDSVSFKRKDGEVEPSGSWMDSVGAAFCCASVFRRWHAKASKTYYEVDTTSPGVGLARTNSETPGQPIPSTLQTPSAVDSDAHSPAVADIPMPKTSKPSKGEKEMEKENATESPVEGSQSLVDTDKCSSTSSTASAASSLDVAID